MLLAIMGSNVSIHISPAPVAVRRPTSMKKTLSVDPHLRRGREINYQLMNLTFFFRASNLPSHVGQGKLDVRNSCFTVGHGRRSNSDKWQCGVGNAQSITANDSITLAQTSSDYVHLPDMFCKKKEKESLISLQSIKKGALLDTPRQGQQLSFSWNSIKINRIFSTLI